MTTGHHTPPDDVRNVVQRALDWIDSGKGGPACTDVTRIRARQLAQGQEVRDAEVRSMRAYFERHLTDRTEPGFAPGTAGFPSPERVAWDARGGDEGMRWISDVDV